MHSPHESHVRAHGACHRSCESPCRRQSLSQRWPTLNPAIAIVAPSGTSAIAFCGESITLSIGPLLLFQSKTLDHRLLDRILVARPARVVFGVEIAAYLIILLHGANELRIVEP